MEVKIHAEPIDSKEEKKYGKFDEWQVKCAVDDICRAEEHKANSELMEYVQPMLEQKLNGMKKTITSLKQLRKRAAAVPMETEEDEE